MRAIIFPYLSHGVYFGKTLQIELERLRDSFVRPDQAAWPGCLNKLKADMRVDFLSLITEYEVGVYDCCRRAL